MKIRMLGFAVAAVLASSAAGAEQTLNRGAALAADGEVEVVNVAGSVSVTGWDRNEVELVAVLEGDKDVLEFSGDARRVVVKLRGPSSSKGPKAATFTLRVPRTALLDLQTVSADVVVAEASGRQRIETVSGDVQTRVFDRDVHVSSVSGEVKLSTQGGKAPSIVSTVSGNVQLDGLAGSVDVQSVSGDMRLSLGTVTRARFKTVSGDVLVGLTLAPDGQVDAGTVSGDTQFRLKPPVNAEFDLESFSGALRACFGPEARHTSEHGPGTELRFKQGTGSARIEVGTLSGDVSICDK